MRTLPVTAVLIAAAALATAACSSSSMAKPKQTRLIVVGDSLSAGNYAKAPDEAFPQKVAAALQAGGDRVQLAVLGLPGATTASLQGYAMPRNGHVVIVEAGTNDYRRQTPRDRFAADYRSLIAAARAASPHAKLICLTTWIPVHAPGAPPAMIPASFYNDTIARECKGGDAVDISRLYADPANRGPAGAPTYVGPADDFHPNSTGHAAIAGLIESALR